MIWNSFEWIYLIGPVIKIVYGTGNVINISIYWVLPWTFFVRLLTHICCFMDKKEEFSEDVKWWSLIRRNPTKVFRIWNLHRMRFSLILFSIIPAVLFVHVYNQRISCGRQSEVSSLFESITTGAFFSPLQSMKPRSQLNVPCICLSTAKDTPTILQSTGDSRAVEGTLNGKCSDFEGGAGDNSNLRSSHSNKAASSDSSRWFFVERN